MYSQAAVTEIKTLPQLISFHDIYFWQLKTDSEKRSVTDGEPWGSSEELKKSEEDLESNLDNSGKWRTHPPGLLEEAEKGGQKGPLPISQTGSWRRGMTAQVGATSSRHKTGGSTIKTPGRKGIESVSCKTSSSLSCLS